MHNSKLWTYDVTSYENGLPTCSDILSAIAKKKKKKRTEWIKIYFIIYKIWTSLDLCLFSRTTDENPTLLVCNKVLDDHVCHVVPVSIAVFVQPVHCGEHQLEEGYRTIIATHGLTAWKNQWMNFFFNENSPHRDKKQQNNVR